MATDVRAAISTHMQWRITFSFHIERQTPLPEELLTRIFHEGKCALGQWMSSREVAPLHCLPEFREVRESHHVFHVEMQRVAESINSGYFQRAARLIDASSSYQRASRRLALAITSLGRVNRS